ncbi:NAD-dependent epimerase/dehydratase family protein [Streptomyces sp. RKND-216]|uniref:NAD-dependent epimerase/dehydratase family protein n=1 Tax=Streptomyces sp. RKND-216 TaxID=2562581 RepID=UPI00109E31BB|nr:NAD-dependent epimerase/dehydratase family protein [Streptomyces sp. RKND-216]THA23582.1 NAD-dependent epimerase/dehydratase family protein [Streptomyces sp. RKND-216]
MRVLVAGGAGFAGWHYVRGLLSWPGAEAGPSGGSGAGERGPRVTVLDTAASHSGKVRAESLARDPACSFVRGDARDARLLASVVPGHDLVVDFTAGTTDGHPGTPEPTSVDARLSAVRALLDAAVRARVPRFVRVSHSGVYGEAGTAPWPENAPLRPGTPHAAATAAGDLLALDRHRTHGLPVLVARGPDAYGGGQSPDAYVPRVLGHLLSGSRVPAEEGQDDAREWLHVTDLCAGVRTAAEHGRAGRVHHVGGGTVLTGRQLTARLLDVCGAGWDMVGHRPSTGTGRRHPALDDGRLRALGHRPRVPLDEGLQGTARWYADHPRWRRTARAA